MTAQNLSWCLDIETLDTESTSTILSIALVYFEIKIPLLISDLRKQSIFIKFDVKEQRKVYGRTVNTDTLSWWAKQTTESQQKSLIPSTSDVCVEDGLFALKEFYAIHGGTQQSFVYTRGSFDTVIVDSLCKRASVKPLTHFSNYRDVRTFIHCMYKNSTAGYIDIDTKLCPDYDASTLVAHDPIDDCIRDICQMMAGKNDD